MEKPREFFFGTCCVCSPDLCVMAVVLWYECVFVHACMFSVELMRVIVSCLMMRHPWIGPS